MPSRRRDIRAALVAPADAPCGVAPGLAEIVGLLPVAASMLRSGRELYPQLRERYAAEGSSAALREEALAAVNDLGTVLQRLRHQRWIGAMAAVTRRDLRELTPPMFLLDTVHNGLLMLALDDPETLEVAVSPAELETFFLALDVRAWFRAVDRWMARVAELEV